MQNHNNRRSRRGGRKSLKILKPPFRPVLHEAKDFEVPQICIYMRIDHVLGHAVKQIVRCNRLDDATLVLCAVVTKGRGAVKFSCQGDTTSGQSNSNCTQNKCTSPDCRSEFWGLARDFLSHEKLKAAHEHSLEDKNAESEANERDQARSINGQPDIACAQNGPKCDSERNDRQDDKDRHRPNRRALSWIAPHKQTEDRTANPANEKLAGDC